MMRLAIIIAAWWLAGSAAADSVKEPAGWKPDPPAAISMSQQLGAVAHFGGQRSIVTTEVYRADRGSLFVTRISISIAGADELARNRAASAELDDVLLGVTRAGPSAIPIAASARAIDGKLLEAAHKWHDKTSNVVTSGRIVIAADSQHMVAVNGECVLASDAPTAIVQACEAALATLDPDVLLTSRVPLAIVKPPPPVSLDLPAAGVGSATLPGPSLVESGARPSLPPMEIPPEKREPDRRAMYVGLGLVVLALIFWWNRKTRQQLERDYEQRVSDKPADEVSETPSKKKPGAGDIDADDLHAAAAAEDGTKESKS